MELHGQTEPFPGSYLQGLLQHGSRLLPVRVLTEGAHADLLVQVDVVPEGNCSYSACRRSLDLRVHENPSTYSPHVRSDTISNDSSHLYFSVRVVGSGIHQVKNKELHGLTEVFAVQRGEVEKDVNRHLEGQKPD